MWLDHIKGPFIYYIQAVGGGGGGLGGMGFWGGGYNFLRGPILGGQF